MHDKNSAQAPHARNGALARLGWGVRVLLGGYGGTGMLKTAKNVSVKATTKALVSEYQNLNSGSLRMKGRNSRS